MAAFDAEKTALEQETARLEEDLKAKRRRLEKLEKVQEALVQEPEPGTVLRFSRPLAGSTRKYTFVVAKIGTGERTWYITGTDNSLRLLGLSNKGNSWQDVLVAIGDAKVKFATNWLTPDEAVEATPFEYFRSMNNGRVYRSRPGSEVVELLRQDHTWGVACLVTRSWLVSNPGSWPRVIDPMEMSRLKNIK